MAHDRAWAGRWLLGVCTELVMDKGVREGEGEGSERGVPIL